jgi:hypothetical protein
MLQGTLRLAEERQTLDFASFVAVGTIREDFTA